jgi:hypothetical protein
MQYSDTSAFLVSPLFTVLCYRFFAYYRKYRIKEMLYRATAFYMVPKYCGTYPECRVNETL